MPIRRNAALLLMLSLASSAALGAGEPQRHQKTGPTRDVAPVVPGFFRGDLRDLGRPAGGEQQAAPGNLQEPDPSAPPPPPGTPVKSSAADEGTTLGAPALTAPILNVPGIGVNGLNTGLNVPDTVGDVGPTNFIQMTNGATGAVYQVFDKITGAQVTVATSLSSLWTNAGSPWSSSICATSTTGDPVVVYDRLAGRWVMAQFTGPSANPPPFAHCVAVAQGPNPLTDGWALYEFQYPSQPDYFKIGVWPDAYLVTSRFNTSISYNYHAWEREAMVAGLPARALFFDVPYDVQDNLSQTATGFPLPADVDGPPPPPGTRPTFLFLVQDEQDCLETQDRLEIRELDLDWNDPAAATLELVQTIRPADGLAPMTLLPCATTNSSSSCIPQAGTSQLVSSLSGALMWRLQYRNFGTHETLVTNTTVDGTGTGIAGIRWWELRRNAGESDWSVFQQGTLSPQPPGNALHFWMGSIAMDGAGNLALGYNTSGPNFFPDIRYTGRVWRTRP